MKLLPYGIFGILVLSGCSFYPSNKSVRTPFCAAAEGEIYEVAAYRVDSTSPQLHAEARGRLRTALGKYPGFRCALPLTGIADPTRGVDLVVWRSVDDAEKAAREVAGDPEVALLRGAARLPDLSGLFQEVTGTAP
jgi:hypothetical protein